MKRKLPWKHLYTEEHVREKIIEEHRGGMEIEELASNSGYHENCVAKILRNFSHARSFKRAAGAGRPPDLTSKDKISISNCVRSKPWLSCGKIKTYLNLEAEAHKIRRFLKVKGYTYKLPKEKPKLSKQNKADRLEWALDHENTDFSNVIFADESTIWMDQWNGRMWIKTGQEHYIEKEAHPEKVQIWVP